MLGYVFWHSFDQLTTYVSRGLFAFGLVVAVIVGVAASSGCGATRSARARARVARRAARQPLLRPVAPYLRAAWRRVERPSARRSRAPARFVWNRLTPGDSGSS